MITIVIKFNGPQFCRYHYTKNVEYRWKNVGGNEFFSRSEEILGKFEVEERKSRQKTVLYGRSHQIFL